MPMAAGTHSYAISKKINSFLAFTLLFPYQREVGTLGTCFSPHGLDSTAAAGHRGQLSSLPWNLRSGKALKAYRVGGSILGQPSWASVSLDATPHAGVMAPASRDARPTENLGVA